jgi:hypothetical protein
MSPAGCTVQISGHGGGIFQRKGQLGTGGPTKGHENIVDEPQQVKNLGEEKGDLGPAVAVAAGDEHALALLEGGKVVAWGDDEYGELGGRASEECGGKVSCFTTPREVEGLKEVASIAAGLQDSFAVRGGKVYSFGKDEDGELGNGFRTEAEEDAPTAISGLEHVQLVSAGNLHTNALLESGIAGPEPLLTVTPSVESLTVAWTYKTSEYKVRVALFEQEHLRAPRYGSNIVVSASSNKRDYELGEYSFTGLTPEPHIIKVLTGEKSRLVVGTPDP